MSKNWSYNPNIGAVNGFGNNPPQVAYSSKLDATSDTTLTVPNLVATGNIRNTVPSTGADTGLVYVIFGYENGATVWVANGVAATPSTTNAFVANASVLNPDCWLVKGGDVLHFYATAQKEVSVAFYPWQA